MRAGAEFWRYYRAIVGRAWVVVLLVALVAGGAYWRVRAAGPRYSATTLVIVTAPVVPRPTQVGTQASGQLQTPNVAMIINDIINLLTSRPVAEPVGARFNMGLPAVRKALSASRIRDTDLIRIRADAGTPQTAADLANTAAEQLIAHFRDLSRGDAREVRLFVAGQLDEARTRLQASDQQVLAYKQSHGILDIVQEVTQATNAAGSLRTDRDATMMRLREAEAKLAEAQGRLRGETAKRVVSGTLVTNPAFQQLETRLTELEIQRATLAQTYTDRYPKLIQLTGEIATIRAEMQRTAKKVLDNEVSEANPVFDQLLQEIATLEVERAAARARLSGITFLAGRQAVERTRLPSVELGLTRLMRENTALTDAYKFLQERYQDALLQENEAGYLRAGVSVMEAAAPPARTAGRLPVQLGLAALVGLALGLVSAVLLEATEDRIRSAQEAEGTLGAPVLATVPDLAPAGHAPGALVLLALIIVIALGMLSPMASRLSIDPRTTAAVAQRIQHVAGLVASMSR